MTSVVRNMLDYSVNGYWEENGDPRSSRFPFMSGLGPTLVLLSSYLLFVLWLGPRLMHNRKPLELTKVLLVYNVTMSLLNLFYFVFIIGSYRYGKDIFDVSIPPFDDESYGTRTKIWVHYTYWLTKIMDLSDTVFFTLRKKQSQITGLHVYHHFSVPLLGWVYFRTNALAPMMIAFALVNTFVHFIMYGYYALSALGPRVQKWLWWKPYITQLQIGQFVFLLAYAIYFLANQREWPKVLVANNIVQAALYLVLFSRFYVHSYSHKSVRRPDETSLDKNNNPQFGSDKKLQ